MEGCQTVGSDGNCNLRQNQILIEETYDNLDLDQIEGAEFEFRGPETRFERNKRNQIWTIEIKILDLKSKIEFR